MSKKNRPPARPPTAEVQLLEMPGTRVMFWAVGVCPFCEGVHYHPAGLLPGRSFVGGSDPQERLGEAASPCGNGPYILSLPPRPLRKKGKRARRTDWSDERHPLDRDDWDDE